MAVAVAPGLDTRLLLESLQYSIITVTLSRNCCSFNLQPCRNWRWS